MVIVRPWSSSKDCTGRILVPEKEICKPGYAVGFASKWISSDHCWS